MYWRMIKLKNMIRAGIYTIEEVLSKRCDVNVKDENSKVDYDGDLIKMNSHRYEVFAVKGLKCVCCGLEGTYFVKEKSIGSIGYHFNLYAINEHGHEILMTKDHIIAKKNGGANHISNYQTMCTKCNNKKGALSQEEFEAQQKSKLKLTV